MQSQYFQYVVTALALLLVGGSSGRCLAQPDPHWLAHDRNRPQPPVVQPGTPSTPERVGRAPADAVVLFDGSDLSAWVGMEGGPTRWIVKDGYMECVKGSGYIRTLQNFGDCQLHIEWATPALVEGGGQGRGNSGVFFGMGRYEVQVLDSYHNPTYPDGSAGSVYGQYPPTVNVSRPPGQWQSYDIVWTAPRFKADGALRSPAYVTVFHNGLLIQNHVELTGPTDWLERAAYRAHPERLPIALQDHGNPVRFRNVWVRQLGEPARQEFTYGTAALDRLTGAYAVNPDLKIEVARDDIQLIATVNGVPFRLFAASPRKFFAKTTDVTFEFREDDQGKVQSVEMSVGEGGHVGRRTK